jgi:EmrB/QacA subfamily drug resistance transporter
VGGAQITSNTLAIITDIFPVGRRGVAMGIQSIIISGGAAIGPTLGGFLVTHFGWQAVFYVNVPIGIVGALTAVAVLPPLQSHRNAEPIDWMGAVTLIGGVSALLLGLTKGPGWGWSSFSVGLLILGGLVIISLFVVHELHARFPLVDLSLFSIREFATAQMAGLFATLAFASLFFLLPFYWQSLRGYSAQQTGLLMLPVPLILMIVAPLSGKASDTLGSRGLATTGMLLIMTGLLMVSQLTETMSILQVLGRLMVFGVGFGLFIAPNNNSVMSCVQPHQRGVAGGLLGMFRYLGQAAGVAFAGALFAFLVADASGDGMHLLSSLSSGDSLASDALSNSHSAFMNGMRGVALAGALFAGIGAVLSLLRGQSPSTRT